MIIVKKIIISLIIFTFLFSTFVFALEDFTVSYEVVNNRILINETAEFDLIIKNNLREEITFLIYPGEVEWDISIVPATDNYKTLGPLEQGRVRVFVKPVKMFWPNLYGSPIRIKNLKTEQVITKEVIVEIRGDISILEGVYLPAVRSYFSLNEKVDPRDGLNINVNLENQNILNISNLRIVLKSGIVSREYETNLLSLEKKKLEYHIPLDNLLTPQKDIMIMDVIVYVNNTPYVFKSPSMDYEIISYGDIIFNNETEKSFLKEEIYIIIDNDGNINRDYNYNLRKKFFNSFFISFSSNPVIEIIDGVSYYSWSGSLFPGQTTELFITKNYRWLFFLFIFVLLLIASYYVFRSSIVVKKIAMVTRKSEGGISQLNIQIYIKNRTAKKFYGIEIRDKVPNLLVVLNEFELGTMHPSSILKHNKRGTIVKWDIEEIEPFEERIISYKVSAKLSILGDFSLPRVAIKYKKDIASDKYRYVHSDVFKMEYE
jgi:hypothetical protein